jgi:hypothetical protein
MARKRRQIETGQVSPPRDNEDLSDWMDEGGTAQPEPAPASAAERKKGETYMTPRGPAIWRGDGWELQ